MKTVYILTITDTANFSKVEHHSAWASWNSANEQAQKSRMELIERDKYHGLGDTFNINICQMEVRGH